MGTFKIISNHDEIGSERKELPTGYYIVYNIL